MNNQPVNNQPVNNQPEPNAHRRLIARASDGQLTPEEALELESILMSDDIAQEFYLDQLFVDGLLQCEFSNTPLLEQTPMKQTVQSDDAARRAPELAGSMRSSWLWAAAALGLAALALFMIRSTIVQRTTSDELKGVQLPLANSRFEEEAIVSGGDAGVATWFGDQAETVASWLPIHPSEGLRMLRFVDSDVGPDDSYDVYQVVDLRPQAAVIERGDRSVVASAFFNALHQQPTVGTCRFSVDLFALEEPPEHVGKEWSEAGAGPIAFASYQLPADLDAESWQKLESNLDLPSTTNFLLVKLSVIDSHKGSQHAIRQHFVDNVSLKLVSAR